MLYYIFPVFCFLIFLINTILTDNLRRFENKLMLPIIILFLVIGMFRSLSVGTDTYNYLQIFNYTESIEVGFYLIILIIKFFGLDFYFFLAFIFFSSFLLKYYSFTKSSFSLSLSLMMYSGFWFLVYDINAIRQGLALGLIGLFFLFYVNKKYYKALIILILGCTIHYSFIIFVPIYFINKVKCNNKLFWSLLLSSMVLGKLEIMPFLVSKLSAVLGGTSVFSAKAESYQNDDLFNQNILYSVTTVNRLLVLFVTFYFVNKIKADDRIKNFFLWASLLNVCLYFLLSNNELIATRLTLYYRFIEVFFISYLPSAFISPLIKILVAFIIFIYVLFQVYQTLNIPFNNLLPYSSTIF